MLVCSVSQLARRAAITADVAETASAEDGATTGNIVFATLVDDPASVSDIVDAYSGEIMLEAASATDTLSVPAVIAADVVEVVTATELVVAVAAAVPATWDTATATNVTLSGGNLTATNTLATTSTDQGARVAPASGKTTGKWYFELTDVGASGGNSMWFGLCTTASTYSGMGGSPFAVTGAAMFRPNGTLFVNGTSIFTIGTLSDGNVLSFAVDLDNRLIWVRRDGGNWNNNASYNPVTGVGGITIPAGTMVPAVGFGGSFGAAGNVSSGNFGATAFVYAVPSGFTSGWPS